MVAAVATAGGVWREVEERRRGGTLINGGLGPDLVPKSAGGGAADPDSGESDPRTEGQGGGAAGRPARLSLRHSRAGFFFFK